MIYWCEDRDFVEREFLRMGFDKQARWRISDVNKNFNLCSSYPRFLILPANFKDSDLEEVAKFRYFRRIPVAVWRYIKNGCFIMRTSQPTVGWFGWFRSALDEGLIQSYVNNTTSPNENNTCVKNNNSSSSSITSSSRNSSSSNNSKLICEHMDTNAGDDEVANHSVNGTGDGNANGNGNGNVVGHDCVDHHSDNIDNDSDNSDNDDRDFSDSNNGICDQMNQLQLKNDTKAVHKITQAATITTTNYLQEQTPTSSTQGSLKNNVNHPNNCHKADSKTKISEAIPPTNNNIKCNLSESANGASNDQSDSIPQTTSEDQASSNRGANKTSTETGSDERYSIESRFTSSTDSTTIAVPESLASRANAITPSSLNDEVSSKIIVIDARSYTAALANRTKGGGCECSEYYQGCEIQFMNLANIHSIRKSYQSIRSACEVYSELSNNWVSFLDNSRWLHHISGLLRSALLIVDAIDIDQKSVLIHCSDGWDRTPQLVALAEIMLDPYYRTFEGFRILVQREWLDFGHKFADRCGSNPCNEDPNERCPVFLQWLDCVQQLLVQYPTEFEFNSSYLDKLNRHTYSNVFATFAYNSPQERFLSRVDEKFPSLWDYFKCTTSRYKNPDYIASNIILRPSNRVKDLYFWKQVYMPPVKHQHQPSFLPDMNDIDGRKYYDSLYDKWTFDGRL